MQGMDIRRRQEDITVTFPYIGDCSCPDIETGKMTYTFDSGGGVSTILSANLTGRQDGSHVLPRDAVSNFFVGSP